MSKRKKIAPEIIEGYKDKSIVHIGSYRLDFSGKVEGGKGIDFTELSSRPNLTKLLVLSLDSLVKTNSNIRSMRTISSYASTIFLFFEFLDNSEFNGAIDRISRITTQTLRDWRSWLYSGGDFSKSVAKRHLERLNVLLDQIRNYPSSFHESTVEDLELPVPFKGAYYDQQPSEPYSENEILIIEKPCRRSIWRTLGAIGQGWKYVESGEDPRQKCGKLGCNSEVWRSKSNILWYIVHELDCNFRGMTWLRENGHYQFVNATSKTGKGGEYRPYSLKEAYCMLLPTTHDLLPFLVMLLIKTGLNMESILSLKRDCIVGYGKTDNFERIRYKKGRGSHEELERPFSNKGLFSPIGLIRAVRSITEPLLKHLPEDERNQLFIGINFNNRGRRIVSWGKDVGSHGRYSGQASYITNMFNRRDPKRGNGLFVSWGLKGDQGEQLLFDSRRFRNFHFTARYRSTGDLGYVSRTVAKHHGSGGTDISSRNYLNNKANEDLHSDAVADALRELVDENTKGKIITSELPADSQDKNIIESIAVENDESDELIEKIAKGEQDVFVAHCRDFYNQPGGKSGAPCSSPWMCFDCENAIWTSRILPKVLAFLDFIEGQREALLEPEWKDKFYKPWSIIKYGILPRFDEDKVNAARILKKNERLFVPINMRSE